MVVQQQNVLVHNRMYWCSIPSFAPCVRHGIVAGVQCVCVCACARARAFVHVYSIYMICMKPMLDGALAVEAREAVDMRVPGVSSFNRSACLSKTVRVCVRD